MTVYRGTHLLKDQVNLFWKQGDFGYVKKMKDTVLRLCESPDPVRDFNLNFYYIFPVRL